MAKKVIVQLKESIKYSAIKTELLYQLEGIGKKNDISIDMIETYMNMWVTCQLLQRDIEKRGAVVKYDNGGGQKGIKKNESIQESNKTNAQMLKILSELGLKTNPTGGGEDEL